MHFILVQKYAANNSLYRKSFPMNKYDIIIFALVTYLFVSYQVKWRSEILAKASIHKLSLTFNFAINFAKICYIKNIKIAKLKIFLVHYM